MAQRGQIFRQVGGNKPKRTAFDLSFDNKLTTNFGKLTPILCKEIVPGDSFKLKSELFLRLSPLLAPIMHEVNATIHYFFVPNRLVWEEWEDFITGESDTPPELPYMESSSMSGYDGIGSLADYLGVPTGISANQVRINALPFRGYQLIYNEYYRDQNLTAEIDYEKTSGEQDDYTSILPMRNRCWEKDYFTSALPWAQAGGDVIMPFTNKERVPVEGYAALDYCDAQDGTALGNPSVHVEAGHDYGDVMTELYIKSGSQQDITASVKLSNGGPYVPSGANWLSADLDGAIGSPTIRDLRRASKLQEWLERNARGGSRYIEQILSHFGVKSSDARLQRPEYIGGMSVPVVVSEVLQQSSSTDTDPTGAMAGHGLAVGSARIRKKFFEEHGYLFGILSVMPKTAYMSGIPRHFLKDDKFDFYFPEFAHIGEQAIWNAEICPQDNHMKETFGYAPRYAEYKYSPSEVHGDFRGNLNFYHLAREFDPSDPPQLNSSFVECDSSELNRIFAIDDSDPDSPYYESVQKIWVEMYNKIVAIRPMPLLGDPRF